MIMLHCIFAANCLGIAKTRLPTTLFLSISAAIVT
ncbi:unnamed protein product [Ixodes persulcatus]